jgi:dipeptidyl aminopeptidase/acylaminoacyl peptidase
MKRYIFSIVSILMVTASFAQKRPLDHSVYDSWQSISDLKSSNNGEWVIYKVDEQQGDSYAVFYNVLTKNQHKVDRVDRYSIHPTTGKAVFTLSPTYKESREARIAKKRPNQMPKDSLGILNLSTGEIVKIPHLSNLEYGQQHSDHIVFELSDSDDKDNGCENALFVMDLNDGSVDTLSNVSEYVATPALEKIIFLTDPIAEDSVGVRGIYRYETSSGKIDTMLKVGERAVISKLTLADDGNCLLFFANFDKNAKPSSPKDIYCLKDGVCRLVLRYDNINIPESMALATTAPKLGNDGSTLYFFVRRKPKPKDNSVPDFEQPKVDVWTWNEGVLMAKQKLSARLELNKTFMMRVDLKDTSKVFALESPELEFTVGRQNTQDFILASTDAPYLIQQQWDMEKQFDLYKVSLRDGDRKLLQRGVRVTNISASPDGRYYLYYSLEEGDFHLLDIVSEHDLNVTALLGRNFKNDINDTPTLPKPWESAVWSSDNRTFYLRDSYDVWQFDAEGKIAPFMLTEGKGEKSGTRYSICSINGTDISGKDEGRLQTEGEPVFFRMFNTITKEHGLAVKTTKKPLEVLCEGKYELKTIRKHNIGQRNNKVKTMYSFIRGNYEEGENIWLADGKFEKAVRISDINPQRKEYNWGTVELTEWTTAKGNRSEGMIFKPEDFDPLKKYPVLIFLYERCSDEIYNIRQPEPSQSVINIPYYVSNGYIVFVPDIHYSIGHPGKSVMEYLMSGCDMLCKNSWIDADNIGIQGQSWGGYEVSFVVTQTDRFKAACAGAPVANMTSGYGGLRWDNGMSRQVQYEQGQSRIGKNLWDGLDLYIENSPLFYVPEVKTPILIMSNDKDGSVPWWQGIEFFTALRRCGKRAWMLQYNDEAHNLLKRHNCMDYTKRLSEFFDHYLKGKPMPEWMEYGEPAIDKL